MSHVCHPCEAGSPVRADAVRGPGRVPTSRGEGDISERARYDEPRLYPRGRPSETRARRRACNGRPEPRVAPRTTVSDSRCVRPVVARAHCAAGPQRSVAAGPEWLTKAKPRRLASPRGRPLFQSRAPPAPAALSLYGSERRRGRTYRHVPRSNRHDALCKLNKHSATYSVCIWPSMDAVPALESIATRDPEVLGEHPVAHS